MKKLLHIFLCLVIVLCFGACHKNPPEINYDASLLYGKWQDGTVFEHYYDKSFEQVLPSGDTVKVNGTTWDESDDVTEDEAQLFIWSLSGATLRHEHVGTFVMVPKIYTITKLDDNNLEYKDDFGTTHQFSKVK